MTETTVPVPDNRNLQWKEQQKSMFDSMLHIASNKLTSLFHADTADVHIEEWEDPLLPDFYTLHATVVVPDNLTHFSIVWNPGKGVVDRNITILSPGQRGKGFGTQINEISETFAKDLGANIFRISAITEPRWFDTLLAQGYQWDEKNTSTVYKKLK